MAQRPQIHHLPPDDLLPSILTTLTSSSDPETIQQVITTLTTSLPSSIPLSSSRTLGQILSIIASSTNSPSSPPPPSTLITSTILTTYLKPLFASSTPSLGLTPSGRPSLYNQQQSSISSSANNPPPLWTSQSHFIIPIFRFAITTNSSSDDDDDNIIRSHWPLFTPVLLSLIEAPDQTTRLQGLNILSLFLHRCPASVLTDSGIGNVFADAVMPILLHLPSLTPEEESVGLLTAGYDALLGLSRKYQAEERRKLLDRVMRSGIFMGFDHASGYVSIVRVLMRESRAVMEALGLFSVKHLENMLSIISKVMEDPFMPSHLPTLIEAAKTLNACLANGWPRMQQHSDHVVKVVSICWLNLHDGLGSEQKSDDFKQLTEDLKMTARVLRKLQQHLMDMSPVLQREPQLIELFSD